MRCSSRGLGSRIAPGGEIHWISNNLSNFPQFMGFLLVKTLYCHSRCFFNKRKSSDFKNLCGLIHEAICTEEMLTSTGVTVPVPSKVTIPVRKFPTFSHFLLQELPLLCAVKQVGVVTWLPSLAYILEGDVMLVFKLFVESVQN